MSGKHGHKPFEGHMHDYEAHITAVEEDLEYYRAKRLEPRIIYLIRRGIVTFYDLLRARAALKRANQFFETRNLRAKIWKLGCVIWKNGLTSMSRGSRLFLHAVSKAWTW